MCVPSTPVLDIVHKQAGVDHGSVGTRGAILAAQHAEGELRLQEERTKRIGRIAMSVGLCQAVDNELLDSLPTATLHKQRTEQVPDQP
jgi:hypothetical protein